MCKGSYVYCQRIRKSINHFQTGSSSFFAFLVGDSGAPPPAAAFPGFTFFSFFSFFTFFFSCYGDGKSLVVWDIDSK